MDFRGIIDIIRKIFNPFPTDVSRKRRADDPVDSYMSPKLRRLHSTLSRDALDFDRENYFLNPKPLRRDSNYQVPLISRKMETIVLDDEDDMKNKKLNGNTSHHSKINKFTSTPQTNFKKRSVNEVDEEDISFVKEIKSPVGKKRESLKKGFNYIRPFSGGIFKPRAVRGERQLKERLRSSLNDSLKNYSVRLDDKMQYKKLLELSNDSSVYLTPKGSLYNYDTANRTSRIMTAALKTPVDNNSKGRMSTKDTIKRVLEDFDVDPVIIKDSDSDSDIVNVKPPSPKPDFKVDPVNSLKKVVDTSIPSKPQWLEQLINRHQTLIAERQKEIDHLKDCSDKHGKINKDMRIEALTKRVHEALQIKDAVFPVEEEEEVVFPTLTEAHLKMINRAFKGDPNEVLNRKFNQSITRRDLLTLAGLNWLNDEVINFYMNMIIERGKDSNVPKAYAFNTFFYPKLIKDGYQSLRRWTKKVDIFEHDIICVPIHLGMHWCMAIIDLRAKFIRYYDSMGGTNNKCLDALRRYLEAEYVDKKKCNYDTSMFELENVTDIPQQMNGSDCGMFSCTFAEFITRDAKITFNQEHMPYLRKKMVIEILLGELLIK